MHKIILSDNPLSQHAIAQILEGPVQVSIEDGYLDRLEKSCEVLQSILKNGETVYGVNTGFGFLARKRIEEKDIKALQKNIVLSHATGVGEPLPENVVRLILVLKIQSFLQGHSGVRKEIVETLLSLVNANACPVIPSQGSVGASGDLAPLANMASVLLGEGKISLNGETLPAAEGLKKVGLSPITLQAKEGLALVNGTQVSTAIALRGLLRVKHLLKVALVTGAMSLEGVGGSVEPFDSRIHEVRRQVGQMRIASYLRMLLQGSELVNFEKHPVRVQDPYSLRCQPQVMGALFDLVQFVSEILLREAHAVTDNPLIFPDSGDVLSGGNFHAEPVALAADQMAMVIAEIGNLSERRVALLVDPSHSTLPAFLVEEGGLNAGFMIAQVTAAALASENKMLSHPASVDSIPTSANQEDHVSMATHGALRLQKMTENLGHILSIELLAATQAIDFHTQMRSASHLHQIHDVLRRAVPFYKEDRNFAPDLEAANRIIWEHPIWLELPVLYGE